MISAFEREKEGLKNLKIGRLENFPGRVGFWKAWVWR
jgi:hypothetical protein